MRERLEEGPWQLPLHAVQVVFQNNTTPDPPLSLSAGCFKLLQYLQLVRYRGKDRAGAGKALKGDFQVPRRCRFSVTEC